MPAFAVANCRRSLPRKMVRTRYRVEGTMTTMTNASRGQTGGQRPQSGGFKQLGRAFGYMSNYRNLALVAVAALLISIAAQLLVPQMIQNILDAVARGMGIEESGATVTNPAIAEL